MLVLLEGFLYQCLAGSPRLSADVKKDPASASRLKSFSMRIYTIVRTTASSSLEYNRGKVNHTW